jgi:hypothetical protein
MGCLTTGCDSTLVGVERGYMGKSLLVAFATAGPKLPGPPSERFPLPGTRCRLQPLNGSASHSALHVCTQIIERSWAALFNCWNPAVAGECHCNNPDDECKPGSCGCLDDLATGTPLNVPGGRPKQQQR